MTLDEAIKHCEEEAKEQNKLCERCDRASGYSRSHNESIRTNEARKHEKCGQEHIQLAGWLRELKAYKEQEPCDSCCGGDQKEKAKLCQKSYLAGLEHKQEPCEDAISRQAVNTLVDELARAISDERCHISRGRSTGEIMQDILDLPSITPKRKTGKWNLLGLDDPSDVKLYRCSECHMKITLKFNYCPNCGAKMEGED